MQGPVGRGWRGGAVLIAVAALYFILFAVLTWPTMAAFSTHYFADDGDGFQNIWNLWWFNFAVTQLGQSPWSTYFLYYPRGTTLVAHTLLPFGGALGIPLRHLLNPMQVYNTVLLLGFVGGAVAAFALAYAVTEHAGISLVAGFVFSFSNYHFAHAQGHLNLVSIEWIPVFVLAWMRLLDQPRVWRGVAAGLVALLVLLCDYYYLLYCAIAALVLLVYRARELNDAFFFTRPPARAAAVAFVVTAGLTCGPFVVALIVLGHRGLSGAHESPIFSADPIAYLIPGINWRFGDYTRWFWGRLPGNGIEQSVAIGVSGALLLFVGWRASFNESPRTAGARWLKPFAWSTLVFAVLSLGPRLRFATFDVPFVRLPYRLLELAFPPIEVSGMPVRMAMMVTLFGGVFIGIGLRTLWRRNLVLRIAGCVLGLLLVVESLPAPLRLTDVTAPALARVLRDLPAPDKQYGLMDGDSVWNSSQQLAYQTVHEVPMAGGHIARIPEDVKRADDRLVALAQQGHYRELCEQWGFRYILIKDADTARADLPPEPLARERDASLFDLSRRWRCRSWSDRWSVAIER